MKDQRDIIPFLYDPPYISVIQGIILHERMSIWDFASVKHGYTPHGKYEIFPYKIILCEGIFLWDFVPTETWVWRNYMIYASFSLCPV